MDSNSPSKRIFEFCEKHAIDANAFSRNYQNCYKMLIEQLTEQVSNSCSRRPLIVGISAPQGAGKTTLVEFFKLIIEKRHNLKVLTLSLDDFYKTRAARQAMANEVHSLFSTRGVPGTHDVNLAISALSALKQWKTGSSIAIPKFDKSNDDRAAESDWQTVTSAIDIVLFEGWCLNAKPQIVEDLNEPINELEEKYDPHAIWRSYVNLELAGDYQNLFNLIDYSMTLYPPSFSTICKWRSQQEQQLIDALEQQELTTSSTMNPTELERFMMHFERISRHHYFNLANENTNKVGNSHKIQLDPNRIATSIV